MLCFGPAVAWFLYAAQSVPHATVPEAGPIALGILGALYFPMALLGLTVSSNWEGLLPHIVIPSIVRSLAAYVVLCVTLAVFAAVSAGLGRLLDVVPILGALVRGVLWFYEMGFLGFALGRFYRAYEGSLRF